MQITGKNLELVRYALDLADAELHNQIATCPDVEKYAEDIIEIEREQVKVRKLLARVNKALNR
jgi:hypothetical protein